MNKEKQIEEMTKAIDRAKYDMWVGKAHQSGDFTNHSKNIATALYNAGYRKQKEGKWVYNEEKDAFFCSLCNREALIDANTIGIDFAIAELSDFCPHCGAKMKGGVE